MHLLCLDPFLRTDFVESLETDIDFYILIMAVPQ